MNVFSHIQKVTKCKQMTRVAFHQERNVQFAIVLTERGYFYSVVANMLDAIVLSRGAESLSELPPCFNPYDNSVNPLIDDYAFFHCDVSDNELETMKEMGMNGDIEQVKKLYEENDKIISASE